MHLHAFRALKLFPTIGLTHHIAGYNEQALAEDIIILDHHEKEIRYRWAVALDQKNNIAAATSTGGMTNKKFGRIGDSPLIGSGTYANNETCAVSCTGHGRVLHPVCRCL